MTSTERLFGAGRAFEHPVTIGAVVLVVLALITASILVRVLRGTERISPETYAELLARTRSWYVLSAAMIVPILLGAAWVCGFFLLLSLFCFGEYGRATGLRSSRSATASVIVAILLTYFAALDHWMGLFTASWPLGICLIVVLGLAPDRPQGYIQRVALATIGFALFGMSLGHLAFLTNDIRFRPLLLWILICTELNDVFAYLAGKTLGRRKLLPATSPNKTWGGAIGAIVLTSLLSAFVGHSVLRDTPLDQPIHWIALGLIISVLGQAGDLVISSIKRDLGVKDMAATIPGHGGLLDRFDSLLLVAPVVFHYLNYFLPGGIGGDQPTRILTGNL
ncbi:MAG: phosphatidate cytidylyltransferase [Planctomycetales bacterium]|nr:phosphatidate cytidylyltransferase [Planctomycetales bacterium]